MAGKVLVVLTSHDSLLHSDKKTGYYLPEIAHPYYIIKDAGYEIVTASPKGGKAPLDQSSVEAFKDDPDSKTFLNDPEAQALVNNTKKLSDVVSNLGEFKAIFYPGGHGPVFDLPQDNDSQQAIRTFYESGRPVSAVCHAPAAFVETKLSNGEHILAGRQVTSFTDAEEEQAGMTKNVPFLTETVIKERGGIFTKAQPWGEHVVVDRSNGRTLITGQNPASAAKVGRELVAALKA